jgi:hypothetical protein
VSDSPEVTDLVRAFNERQGPCNADLWRRVGLVERGLGDRVLFAVSSRLRVSEEVLGDSEAGALCVYKGQMSPAAIERKLDRMTGAKRG